MTRLIDRVAERRGVRLFSMVAASALLAVSLGGLWHSSSPAAAQEIQAAQYQHRGQFDYVVYVTPGILYGDQFEAAVDDADAAAPADAEQPATQVPTVFFRELLEDFNMSFSYHLDCSQPLRTVRNDAAVTITAEHPGMWQREMRDWSITRHGDELRLDFAVDYGLMEFFVRNIEEEIGISRTQRDFIVEARVHTVAETFNGQVLDRVFVHSVRVILRDRTLELNGDLQRTARQADGEAQFTMQGRFDYEAYMKYSRLYDAEVLRSEPLPSAPDYDAGEPTQRPPVVTKIGPGQVLYPKTIEAIDATFAYDFASDQRVSGATHDIGIVATLSSGDRWKKQLELVPSRESGTGSVSFPIDVHYFDRVVEAIGEQTGVRTGSYDISIEARVHTRADVADGAVDEVYTQVLTGRRDGALLTFGDELSSTQQGTLDAPQAPGTTEDGVPWRPLSVAGVSVSVLALAFLGAVQVRGGRRDPFAAEVAKARKRHGDMLVDVEAMPAANPGDSTVPLRTLDDLARVAEQAGKPVLHCGDSGRSVFCVLDGDVRYVHTLQREPHQGAMD